MINYKVGDYVYIPIIKDMKITRTSLILNDNYNNDNDWKENIGIFKLLEDNQHVINIDIRCHHYLTFIDNESKSIQYNKFVWDEMNSVTSVAFAQFLAHRLYEKYGFGAARPLLEESLNRAEQLNIHKWMVSARFFIAEYSHDKEIIEKEFIKILNPSKIMVDLDCYESKILFILLWLELFGSRESRKVYDDFIQFLWSIDDNMKTHLANLIVRMDMNEVRIYLDKFDMYGFIIYVRKLHTQILAG